MSFEYDNYLLKHREGVKKGFEWMKEVLEKGEEDGSGKTPIQY